LASAVATLASRALHSTLNDHRKTINDHSVARLVTPRNPLCYIDWAKYGERGTVMAEQRPFDGTQQAKGLKSFLVFEGGKYYSRSGRTLTDIAGDLGLSYGTVWKYVNGYTPLGSEQFADFARAFETDVPELLRACFPALRAAERASDPSQTWDAREEMRNRNVPEDRIKQEWEAICDYPERDQRERVEVVLEEYDQKEVAPSDASPRTRKGTRRVG
jgi:transcriptional regulator with XRE-family HTH domain